MQVFMLPKYGLTGYNEINVYFSVKSDTLVFLKSNFQDDLESQSFNTKSELQFEVK